MYFSLGYADISSSSGGNTLVTTGVSLASNGATLTFPSIMEVDAGTYHCVANNSAGSGSASIQVFVSGECVCVCFVCVCV